MQAVRTWTVQELQVLVDPDPSEAPRDAGLGSARASPAPEEAVDEGRLANVGEADDCCSNRPGLEAALCPLGVDPGAQLQGLLDDFRAPLAALPAGPDDRRIQPGQVALPDLHVCGADHVGPIDDYHLGLVADPVGDLGMEGRDGDSGVQHLRQHRCFRIIRMLHAIMPLFIDWGGSAILHVITLLLPSADLIG